MAGTIHYYHNRQQIMHFQHYDEDWHIKAFDGKLSVYERTYFNRAYGAYYGTRLEETSKIIEEVCKQALKDLEFFFENVIKNFNLPVLPAKKKFFELIRLRKTIDEEKKLINGLNNIVKALKTWYLEDEKRKGLKELIQLSSMVGTSINEISKRQQKELFDFTPILQEELEEGAKNKDLCSFFRVSKRTDHQSYLDTYGHQLGRDWETVPMEAVPCLTSQKGKAPIQWPEKILTTIMNLAKTYLFCKQPQDFEEQQLMRISDPGMMLTSSIVQKFLEVLGKDYDFTHISNFYLCSENAVNDQSLKEIKQSFKKLDEVITNSMQITVIPVVFKKAGFFSRDHMATIFIKEGCIEYFDPLNIPSVKRPLKDECHFYDVLAFLKKTCFGNEGKIVETGTKYQNDSINCGAYACLFIEHRLQGKNLPPPEMIDIDRVRERIKEKIAPVFADEPQRCSTEDQWEEIVTSYMVNI